MLACSACWAFHEDDDATTSPPAPSLPTAGSCAGASCGAAGGVVEGGPSVTAERRARAPEVNPGDSLCRAGELAVHCVVAPPLLTCPSDAGGAAREACKDGAESYRVACNACGGVTVELVLPFYTLDIHFDATERLAGVTLTEDSPIGPCEQEEFVFSRHCTVVGERETRSCDALRGELTQID